MVQVIEICILDPWPVPDVQFSIQHFHNVLYVLRRLCTCWLVPILCVKSAMTQDEHNRKVWESVLNHHGKGPLLPNGEFIDTDPS